MSVEEEAVLLLSLVALPSKSRGLLRALREDSMGIRVRVASRDRRRCSDFGRERRGFLSSHRSYWWQAISLGTA